MFQSLKGNPINCDSPVLGTNHSPGRVSIPKRESNQLRYLAPGTSTYQPLFQSLKGNPINCDFAFSAYRLPIDRFQSLKGNPINCDFTMVTDSDCPVPFQSLKGNPINCDENRPPLISNPVQFQSLKGNPINCDMPKEYAYSWFQHVSIPKRESNQLR